MKCITFSWFSLMHSFGQDIPLSPSRAIPDPALSHIYLYSPQSLMLFSMVFPDVEAEWGPRPRLVLYPLHAAHGKPVRASPAVLARHKELWKFVLLASPLHTDCQPRLVISFSSLLAKDKMRLLKNVVTRKLHNFCLKTTSFPFWKWSYLRWMS